MQDAGCRMQDAGCRMQDSCATLPTVQKHLNKCVVVKYPEHDNYLK
jgi:hypothetical protein